MQLPDDFLADCVDILENRRHKPAQHRQQNHSPHVSSKPDVSRDSNPPHVSSKPDVSEIVIFCKMPTLSPLNSRFSCFPDVLMLTRIWAMPKLRKGLQPHVLGLSHAEHCTSSSFIARIFRRITSTECSEVPEWNLL